MAEIEVEEYDDDAETQARIWNVFANERAEEFNCVVTAEQIRGTFTQRPAARSLN